MKTIINLHKIQKKDAKHKNRKLLSFLEKIFLECKKIYHDEYFQEYILFDSDNINVFCFEHQDIYFDYFCLDYHKEICNKCINEGNKHLN